MTTANTISPRRVQAIGLLPDEARVWNALSAEKKLSMLAYITCAVWAQYAGLESLETIAKDCFGSIGLAHYCCEQTEEQFPELSKVSKRLHLAGEKQLLSATTKSMAARILPSFKEIFPFTNPESVHCGCIVLHRSQIESEYTTRAFLKDRNANEWLLRVNERQIALIPVNLKRQWRHITDGVEQNDWYITCLL